MIDFFTSVYSYTFIRKDSLFHKMKIDSMARFIIRNMVNILLPLQYKRYNQSKNQKENLIISLTSFPARINNVHLVIESILRQTIRPEKIILWLSQEQFQSLDSLPSKLLLLRDRGLDIIFVDEDIRSFKKFYYTVKRYPEFDFIIIDDDVFYPSDLIENLLEYQKKFPGNVIFNRGRKVLVKDNEIQSYREWEKLKGQKEPSYDIMPTGMGAVLYPKNILPKEVLNKSVFLQHCKFADDIWLYAMVLHNNKSLVKTNEDRTFIPVLNKNDESLAKTNRNLLRNDIQLESLKKYYKTERGIDLFKNVKN